MSLLRFLQRLTAQWEAIARTPSKQVLGVNSNIKNRKQPYYHHDPLLMAERTYRYATGITRWTVLEMIEELLSDTEEQFILIYRTLFDIRFGEMMHAPSETSITHVAQPNPSGLIGLLSWATPSAAKATDVKHHSSSSSIQLPSSSPTDPSVLTTFNSSLIKNEHKQEIQARITSLQKVAEVVKLAVIGLKNTQDAPGYKPDDNATYKERCDALIQKMELLHKEKLSICLETLERVYGHLKAI